MAQVHQSIQQVRVSRSAIGEFAEQAFQIDEPRPGQFDPARNRLGSGRGLDGSDIDLQLLHAR